MVCWSNGCCIAGRREPDALAKPHAACVSFDWRGWHWKDYYHFRTHAGCFLSFFSGQTWRRRAIHWFPPLVIPNLIAISNDCYRHEHAILLALIVCQSAQQAPCLENKRARDETTLGAKNLLIQDEISFVPAAVETWCCTAACGHVKTKAWIQVAIFMLASWWDTYQSADWRWFPADQACQRDIISWQSEELVRKRPDKVQTEHYAAQAALMSIETVIHLKKSKRFLDVHLPKITTAMRTCTPAAPLSEDHLRQLRTRKIENCKKELETDSSSMAMWLACTGRTLRAAWWKGHIEMHGSLMCHYFVCRRLTKDMQGRIRL